MRYHDNFWHGLFVYCFYCVCLEGGKRKRPVVIGSVSPLGQLFRPDSTRVRAAETGGLGVQNFLCRTEEPESHDEV